MAKEWRDYIDSWSRIIYALHTKHNYRGMESVSVRVLNESQTRPGCYVYEVVKETVQHRTFCRPKKFSYQYLKITYEDPQDETCEPKITIEDMTPIQGDI
nr:hypothetical transcript [Hymenolepis microstoma]